MPEIAFNVNHYIKIQLTERGKEILKNMHYTEHLLSSADANGWIKIQMWQAFNLFGEFICNGCDVPFNTEIFIITEK